MNTSLTKITLGGNKIGVEERQSEALKVNTSLTKFVAIVRLVI